MRQSPAGEWSLWRGGKRLRILGAGGDKHLELLRAMGGNTIRTWSIDQLEHRVDGETLLDRCHALDIGIMAGIWLEHERHGFSYDDPARLAAQRQKVVAGVRRHKHHPAILLWGLGNEMEGPNDAGTDPRVWRELETLARLVKAEDPDHPICTVIAGAAAPKVRALMRDYPSLDILGVNAYAEAPHVATALADAGWHRPFILAEYGPVGHWQIRQTAWGAPVEPASRTKVASYLRAHRRILQEGAGRCLGTFAFFWGQKQETTSTWYGMFLRSGERLPAVDAVSRLWTGQWPSPRAPLPRSIEASFAESDVPADSVLYARIHWDQPAAPRSKQNSTQLSTARWRRVWRVVAESTDRRQGGDPEAAPPEIEGLILRAEGDEVEFRAPSVPGPYRLFLHVLDEHGAACAENIPFRVIAAGTLVA